MFKKLRSLDTSSLRRIAIVRLSAMGDCILLQPVVLRILSQSPLVEIDWYIDPAWVSLFPKIDRLNMKPLKKPRSIQEYLHAREQLSQKSYDVLLAMQASLRSNILYSFIRAPIKIGFDKRRARDGQRFWTTHSIQAGEDHLLDGFARFADALELAKEPVRWQLVGAKVSDFPRELRRIFDSGRRIVGILPAASKKERTPMGEFWQRLVQEMAKFEKPPVVVILGGPSAFERQLASNIVGSRADGLEVMNLVGQTSLYLLSGIVRELACLVSPDSGPVHLANAQGVPVIGLYAVAPSTLSGPYNNLSLTFDVYAQAVQQFLGKNVAEVTWGTRVHDRRAMGLIEPSAVAQRVERLCSRGCTQGM